MRKRGLLAAVSTGVMVASLAACGGGDDGGSNKGDGGGSDGGKGSFILGTTDSITSMDPAGAYDTGSWNLQYSVFEQLMVINEGATDPSGDAAESCKYDDPKTVTCKLRAGDKFSNGDELTSSDVKFSFQRNLTIADPNGASGLLFQLTDKDGKFRDDSIETPDDTTVTFHLNTPDTTFIKVLTTAAASIVDEDVFPADKLLDDDKVIGSGPLKLSQYKPGEQAVFEKNDAYDGARTSKASQIFVQFFKDPAPLKEAIKTDQVNVAWRTLSPTDLQDLKDNSNAQVIEGKGAEFRYWVFQLGTEVGKNKAVRQAAAQIIDRATITKDAYDGTTTPAYSTVPPGFGGQKDSFKEKYGDAPDVAAAKKTLADAGVKTPVELTMGWTPTHYGPNLVDEAKEFSDELNNSGLFKVSLKSAEWEQYQTLYKKNAYDIFALGWYPDFLDADNYVSPFIRDGGFFENGYTNPEVNKLIEQELAETDAAKRDALFGQLQDIAAEDVPYIPSWFGKNIAVAGPGVTGVQETLDPTYIFRLWTISKS